MMKRIGNISIPGDTDVWPHEYQTAVALARAGYDVIFIKKSNEQRERTPDVLINGERWEMKAPKASTARAVERNLHRALQQSARVVFDCRRMKNLPDSMTERELKKRVKELRSLKRLLLVDFRSQPNTLSK